MCGGFRVCAHRNKVIEFPSEMADDQVDGFGEDVLYEMTTAAAERAPKHTWKICRGNAGCPNLWDIKVKQLDLDRHIPGMVQTRVYIGTPRIGKTNPARKQSFDEEKQHSCENIPRRRQRRFDETASFEERDRSCGEADGQRVRTMKRKLCSCAMYCCSVAIKPPDGLTGAHRHNSQTVNAPWATVTEAVGACKATVCIHRRDRRHDAKYL